MKSISKFLLIFSTVCVSLLGTSCTENIEYSPAEKLNGAQVYFSSLTPSKVDLDQSQTTYSLQLMRVETEGDLTVALNVTSETDKLTIPSSVSFADGESVTNVNITYSLDELGYDNYSNVSISLADESNSTPYGPSSLTFSIGIPAPWTSLGMATFVEDFLTTFFSVENVPYEVEIQESDLYEGLYRLVNPFGKAYPYNAEGDWDTSKDYYLEINATDPDGVYITTQESGMNWGYGNFFFSSYAGYYIEQAGWSVDQIKAEGYAGSLKDGVITFPVGTLLVGMTDYNGGALYNANLNGAFKVALPGVQLTDYSLNITYAGNQVNEQGAVKGVIATVNAVGADVESLNLAVVPGNGSDLDVTSVLANSISVDVANMELPASVVVPVELQTSGFYTLVAIASAGDVVCNVSTAVFRYSLSEETWTERYVGTYRFNNPIMSQSGILSEENLVISQSDNNPYKWKISGSEIFDGFEFLYDEVKNQVSVYESTIMGGQLYIKNQTSGGQVVYGKKEGNKFIFNVNYFVSEGDYGNYQEELLLTGAISGELNRDAKQVRTLNNRGKQAFAY